MLWNTSLVPYTSAPSWRVSKYTRRKFNLISWVELISRNRPILVTWDNWIRYHKFRRGLIRDDDTVSRMCRKDQWDSRQELVPIKNLSALWENCRDNKSKRLKGAATTHNATTNTSTDETPTLEEFLQAQAADRDFQAAVQTVQITSSSFPYNCNAFFLQHALVHWDLPKYAHSNYTPAQYISNTIQP